MQDIEHYNELACRFVLKTQVDEQVANDYLSIISIISIISISICCW
jgi:hypothetical protein